MDVAVTGSGRGKFSRRGCVSQAEIQAELTRGYQKKAVAMPNTISATAPSITSRSSTASPGAGRDNGMAALRRLTIHRHPHIPAPFAAPVLDAWGSGEILQLNFVHGARLKAMRTRRNGYAVRRRSMKPIERHNSPRNGGIDHPTSIQLLDLSACLQSPRDANRDAHRWATFDHPSSPTHNGTLDNGADCADEVGRSRSRTCSVYKPLPYFGVAVSQETLCGHNESKRRILLNRLRWGTEAMEMQISAEIRWFWLRSAPPQLREWFESEAIHGCPVGGGDTKDPRPDLYLREAMQTELGIKARAGKIVEVKGLVAISWSGLADGPFRGPIEIWSK